MGVCMCAQVYAWVCVKSSPRKTKHRDQIHTWSCGFFSLQPGTCRMGKPGAEQLLRDVHYPVCWARASPTAPAPLGHPSRTHKAAGKRFCTEGGLQLTGEATMWQPGHGRSETGRQRLTVKTSSSSASSQLGRQFMSMWATGGSEAKCGGTNSTSLGITICVCPLHLGVVLHSGPGCLLLHREGECLLLHLLVLN